MMKDLRLKECTMLLDSLTQAYAILEPDKDLITGNPNDSPERDKALECINKVLDIIYNDLHA